MSRTLESDVRRQLHRALPVAFQRIESSTACAALFEKLGVDPTEVLNSTLYFPAPSRQESTICQGVGAAAFTTVGGRATWLCSNFGSLRVHHAARLILHEALHHAGLPERPLVASALNSHQINLLVSKSCGL